MNGRRLVSTVSHFLHAHFLWLLLGSYVMAALWPGFGLWIRDVCLGEVSMASSAKPIPKLSQLLS